MTTIPNIVEDIIKKKPFLEDALVNGLVNLSALARHMKPEIEKLVDKPVNDSAIIMALNRLIPRMKLVSTMKFRNIVSNIGDILHYIALQIESDAPFIASAHTLCPESARRKDNHLMCIGWHTYKRSNQLWHVGGVGTFRTSVILNRHRRLGVAVLGNAKGKTSANAHYIAKMLYSELKTKRIRLPH